MCWSPLLSTTQYVLDTTIKHNTICVGHYYKTQHNMCIVLCLIVVSNTYLVVLYSGDQHILSCA
jgi:hypothetical protein